MKVVTVDLSQLPYQSPDMAWGIHVLRRDSHPGARLIMPTGGKGSLGPGDWVRGRFEPGWQLINNNGATSGSVVLQLLTNPFGKFHEYEGPDAMYQRQVLLGTINSAGVVGYAAVPKNTPPTTLTTTGVFDASGFRAIELYLDGAAANTMATVDLIPWNIPQGVVATYWSAQADQTKSLLDTTPTADRYRMVAFNTDGAPGLTYFEIRNQLPAGGTGLGMMVVGVR